MKKVLIINGPNLNLLGTRQIDVYGEESWDTYLEKLKALFPDIEIDYFQSNHEGEIVEVLQEYEDTANGIVINAGAYSHTSVAIADAIAAITCPVYCVHISLVHAREQFRSEDLVAQYADGYISGLGLDGYQLAIEYLLDS